MDRPHTVTPRRRASGAIAGIILASFVWAGAATAATDTKAPIVRAPIVSLRDRAGVGANAPVWIDFLATDTGSGVVTSSYGNKIAISRNGSAYREIQTGSRGASPNVYPTPPGSAWISAQRSLQFTGTYRVRVRAEDKARNWSKWVYGPTFTARMLQENSSVFKYSSGWTRSPGPWLGGYAMTTSAADATVTGTVTASSIAWVARHVPGNGLAEVWVDGVLEATVILNNSYPGAGPRQVVFSKTWARVGTHRITIHALGTGPVEFDGLLKIR